MSLCYAARKVRKTVRTGTRTARSVEFVLPVWARNAKAKIVRYATTGGNVILVTTDSPSPETMVPRGHLSSITGYKIVSFLEVPVGSSPKTRRTETAPHFRFANAKKDNQLLRFVEDFGPVLSAPDLPPHHDELGNELEDRSASATEILTLLRAERNRFAALLRLIQILKAEHFERTGVIKTVKEVADLFGEGDPPHVPIQTFFVRDLESFDDVGLEGFVLEDLATFLRPFAFHPQVVNDPMTGRFSVFAGPNREGKGFRPVLYGLLLEELVGHGGLRTCRNPSCGAIFRPPRPDCIYCGEDCRNRAKAARSYRAGKERAVTPKARRVRFRRGGFD